MLSAPIRHHRATHWVAEMENAIIGSGVRRSKLFLPGKRIGDLPGAGVIEGLANGA